MKDAQTHRLAAGVTTFHNPGGKSLEILYKYFNKIATCYCIIMLDSLY